MEHHKIAQIFDNPRILSWLMVVVPLISIVVVFSSMLVPPEASVPAETDNGGSSGFLTLVIFSVLGLKLTAVVGVVKKWYFTWVYQLIEANFLVFLMGLLLIIGVLTLELSVVSGVKIALCFGLVFLNIKIKHHWLTRDTRGFYCVPHVTHA